MNISILKRNRRVCTYRNYFLITFVITLWTHSACSLRAEADIPVSSIDKTTIGPALQEAERLFANREDLANLKAAVKTLASIRDPAERSFEVEWKFAKFSYFLGKRLDASSEAEEILESGKKAALIASKISPGRPEGHFWYAANLGELSRMNPITVGIKSVDDIREALNRVIQIDPTYQSASAYDALGQLEMETRSLKGGKAEKAVEYFEKGLELSKDNANIRANLAEVYFAVKRDSDARTQIAELLKMTPNPEYKFEHDAAVERAKRLLKNQP
ncbi:tetratricopeptide repeat protein [Leptolyngbya sp. 7M]|uniref:tetratricopeptide repeat protein n=1 Tax=Leptolyngbya sp. 7M TaxID=2812896 RepID=UPI001B8BC697|nr:TRAP transporter TatT component family protein [Leptolyngbya sp. 7M]QYO65216.1 tetratricopeptide repeat protein [Leptolyngbya sp. 7M]